MGDSWRVRMGTPAMESPASLPRRRRSTFADPSALNPEDFSDVFGGPPRSVFLRKMVGGEFSVPYAGVNSFYEEIFRPQDTQISGDLSGRGLPAFRIPGERFYSDVFGAESAGEERWKAMSKSNSSSVLSSEDMSPLRPIAGDHMAFADLSSKLRPLNVGSRRKSSSMNKNNNNNPSYCTNPPSKAESHSWNTSFGIKYNFGFSRRVSSPETISLGPDSYPSVKVSGDESPSSVVSSLCHEDEDDKMVEASSEDEDDDEMMSSYVIEIGSGSDRREETNNSCDAAVCIDEAIAWAKESFHSHSAASEKDSSDTNTNNNSTSNSEVKDDQSSKMDQDQNTENKHVIVQYSPKMEMRLQDENVRLWSVGKETDIRLLLSTLHYILWNNSGWSAIPLTNLINSTQLKKAYQKARLCLHPDKLQQRGATLPQKYIAEKTFSVLQDAWATFTSQDVS